MSVEKSVEGGFLSGFGGCLGVGLAIIFVFALGVGGCTLMVGGCTKAVVDAQVEHEKARITTNQQVVGSSPSKSKSNSPSVSPTSPSPPKQEWADANQAVRQGDVQVRIAKVAVDYVQIKDFGSSKSKDKLFIVSLAITNLNPTKIVNYKGWGARELDFSGEDRAALGDDADNSYKRVHFGLGSRIDGQVFGNESIYPNKTINDIVVFEPPTDAAKFVLLQLPASGFGGNGMLRIKIPRAMWDGNVITPAKAAQNKNEPRKKAAEEDERRAADAVDPSLREPNPIKNQATEQSRWHTWTSADGKFTVEAKFVKSTAGVVHLEKQDSTTIKVPMEKLSDDDQHFIKNKGWEGSLK